LDAGVEGDIALLAEGTADRFNPAVVAAVVDRNCRREILLPIFDAP
jgi:hypothetical protein